MARHASSLEDPRFAETKKKVAGWLRAGAYTIHENQDDRMAWVIAATGSDPTLILFQERKFPDHIGIQAALRMDPSSVAAVGNLPAVERTELLWDLRFRILALGVHTFGLEEPLEGVTVLTQLFLDGMNRNEFERTLQGVRAGIYAFKWTVLRALGAPLGAEEKPAAIIH
jgi:hypothetical protein